MNEVQNMGCTIGLSLLHEMRLLREVTLLVLKTIFQAEICNLISCNVTLITLAAVLGKCPTHKHFPSAAEAVQHISYYTSQKLLCKMSSHAMTSVVKGNHIYSNLFTVKLLKAETLPVSTVLKHGQNSLCDKTQRDGKNLDDRVLTDGAAHYSKVSLQRSGHPFTLHLC